MTGEDAAAVAAAEERILEEMRKILVSVLGEEYALDLEIGMPTTFNADLELESIEFVALAEALRKRYGDRVDFVAFLADKEVNEIIEMTVGDVVSYVATSLADD